MYFGISIPQFTGISVVSMCHLALWSNPTEVMGNPTVADWIQVYNGWCIYRFKCIITSRANRLMCTSASENQLN